MTSNEDIDEKVTKNPNKFVYLDIRIGEEKAGRVIIELFYDKAPKTAENFRCLITGEKGIGRCGKPLHFKNTIFHRVVPHFMVQGGDIVCKDGTGGESIYGLSFEDETFAVSHELEGIVGMANKGPNTNSSQFYITTVPCTHLDEQNVAFGQVRRGLNIIREMGTVPQKNDFPSVNCWIEDCGEIKPDQPLDVSENDVTDDSYPPWPDDWVVDAPKEMTDFVKAVDVIKDSGNFYYKGKNFPNANRKYKKALRYIEYLEQQKKPYEREVQTLKTYTLLNLAAVKLKEEDYHQALQFCNQALDLEPNNTKALYRRAQARMGLRDYEEALVDFRIIQKKCPEAKHLQSLIESAMKLKTEYLKKEKVLFTKMFQ